MTTCSVIAASDAGGDADKVTDAEREPPGAGGPRGEGEEGADGGAPGGAERRRVQSQLLSHERIERDLRVLHEARRHRLRPPCRQSLRPVDQPQPALLL